MKLISGRWSGLCDITSFMCLNHRINLNQCEYHLPQIVPPFSAMLQASGVKGCHRALERFGSGTSQTNASSFGSFMSSHMDIHGLVQAKRGKQTG